MCRIGICLCLCLVLILGTLSHSGGQGSLFRAETATASGESSSGASNTLDLTRPDEGYMATLYNNRTGLPTSEANAIAQTEEGFIWIGSYSGLIRYDGNVFERMDSTTGIASVVSLLVDSKNRLWVGTNDSGVAVIDKGKTRMFRTEDGLKSLSVRTIAEDKKGNIYCGTTRGVLEINEAMVVRTLENPSIRDEYIRQMTTGADGLIYGVTQTGHIFTLEDGTVNGSYDLAECGIENIATVYPDPDFYGYVYIGAGDGVYYGKLTNRDPEFEKISVGELSRVNEIVKVYDTLWLCAENGIGYISNGVPQILDNVPMKNVSVDHMLCDYQGNVWFTSSRKGVMKLSRNRFVDISEWCDLPTMVVNSTCVSENRLLIGTDTGLLVVENMKITNNLPITSARLFTGESVGDGVTNLAELLEGCRIRSVIHDSKGRVWISTFSKYGLVRYDAGEVVCFVMQDDTEETAAHSLPSNRARAVYECRDGAILAACTGGLAVIRGETVEKVYNEKNGLHNVEILTAVEAPNGDYIIGTDGGGLYILSGDLPPRVYDTSSGLSSEVVLRIKRDMVNDVYWIVTSNSLAYLNSAYEVKTIWNFPYSNNFDLYTNSKGEVWILSSNGVYVTTVGNLIANKEIEYTFYNWNSGLPYVATANSYSALTDDGYLYIACSEGIARVNIEQPFDDATALKMAMPYVVADGVEIYPDDDGVIRIPAKTKKLVINSFVYTYTLKNPLVTFWLEGFDQGKTTLKRSEMMPISYTNLRGGTYCFKMTVQDVEGNRNLELSVTIVKKKAVYETWWFQMIGILAGAALLCWLVYLYVQRKMKKLIAKEEEQKTFINEMTEAFAKTIDMKDSYTNGHSFRVAKYTTMLAEELGYSKDDIEKYHNIALLHDIGKIGVDDKVLNKAGKLDDDEFKQIKSHAYRGYEVLKDISIMPELAIGAGAHHERPDGKGYPKGLKGDEIPRVAQIIAVADTFDAMYSDRPYRKRMNFEKAVSIIRDAAGTQLAADVVDAFLRLVDKGYFRAPDDVGGGTSEDIDNIHKSFNRAQEIKAAHMPAAMREKAAREEQKSEQQKEQPEMEQAEEPKPEQEKEQPKNEEAEEPKPKETEA